MMRVVLGMLTIAGTVLSEEWRVTRIVALSEYPALARHAGISGRVLLQCSIEQQNEVPNCTILSGDKVLAQAAKDNAEKWRFRVTGARSHSIPLVYTFVLTAAGSSHQRPIASFVFQHPSSVRIVSAKGCSDHLPCPGEE
jgi:TonB family protein